MTRTHLKKSRLSLKASPGAPMAEALYSVATATTCQPTTVVRAPGMLPSTNAPHFQFSNCFPLLPVINVSITSFDYFE